MLLQGINNVKLTLFVYCYITWDSTVLQRIVWWYHVQISTVFV